MSSKPVWSPYQVSGQPGLHNKTLSKLNKYINSKKTNKCKSKFLATKETKIFF